jgi:hypothetical protein
MSRPLRFLLPATCAALSLGFSACVGTVYDRMYSNRVTHYKPPQDKKEASAADLLAEAEARKVISDMPAEAAPGAIPADAGIPGLAPPPGDAAMPAPGAAPMAPPPIPPPPL